MLLTPAQGCGDSTYLVRPGTALERHLPHVLPVILRDTARADQGRHQVILNGLEFRGPNIPLRKREEKLFLLSHYPL